MSDDEEIVAPPDEADELRDMVSDAVEGQESPEATEAKEATEAAARARDDKGRFAAGEGARHAPTAAAPTAEAPTAAHHPPPGFSVATKSMWDSIPEPVKADIAKREYEFNAGMQRFTGLSKFAEEAERNGTSLQNAVTDYAGVERALRQDFISGIEHICKRMSVDPRALVAEMYKRYGGQGAQQAHQSAPAHVDPDAIVRRATEAMEAKIAERDTMAQIEAFKGNPKNVYFDNVRQHMAVIVASGQAATLQEAYKAACWLNPEIRALLIKEQMDGRNKGATAAVNSARNAAKAVGGSPAPGLNPDKAGRRSDLSLRDQVNASIDAQST